MASPTYIPASWRARWSSIEHCWQTGHPEPALRRRLLDRQLDTWKNGHWINHLSMLSAALLVVVSADSLLSPLAAIGWLLLLLFNPIAGIGLRHLHVALPWRTHLGTRLGAQRRLLLQALTTGCIYQSVASWLYLSGEASQSLLIGLITCGVLCSGALGFSRIPQIGLVWVGVLGAANIATLLCSPRPHDTTVALAMVGYLLVLAKDMLVSSRGFVRRCEAEFEAERQSHMVSLMLSEFEGSSQDWFWETDAQGRLTHASPRLCEVVRLPHDALLGRSLTEVLALLPTPDADRERQSALQTLTQRLQGRKPFRDLVVPLPVGTERHWWSMGARPLLDTHGTVQGWRGLGTDVTALRRHEQELRRLAHTDNLTGQASRHGFQQRLRGHLAQPDLPPFALLMVDLDSFKELNDAHGHAIGDALLQAVAQRLAGAVPQDAMLARLGGDEFAVVSPQEITVAAAECLGHQLLEVLRQPFQIGMVQVEVRASLGLALAPMHGQDDVALLRAADMALYAAKAAGRDRLHLYDHATGQRAQHRALLTRELTQALALEQFVLDYQPVFDANTGKPTGAEALLRWAHPRLGRLAPGEFIELAEESGLITTIGTWVLRSACSEAVHWPAHLRVAVNLSVRQLRDAQIVRDVQQILTDTGLPAARLELEITESALADETQARTQLSGLNALGVRLALDDFGTGYSSLSYLQRFRFDRLKIDRSFVLPLRQPDNVQQVALVKAVIDMAAALQLRCTAEGIEDDAQAAALRRLGCDELQGFQLGRPMEATQLRHHLVSA